MAAFLLRGSRCYHAASRLHWPVHFLLLLSLILVLHSCLGVRLLLYTQYDSSPLDPIGRWGALSPSRFNFTTAHRPEWLNRPPTSNATRPLKLRLAIITHPSEFKQRKAFRQYILSHLPAQELSIDYRFVMGHAGSTYVVKVAEEQKQHRDILLLNMDEGKKRLGEKRWWMLQWAAEADVDEYDYYMSVDTDAFVRFTALARRLHDYGATHPGNRSVLWARIGTHSAHFLPREDESHPEEPDDQLIDWHPDKFWYSYPFGYAFLLSSALVGRLMRPGMVLPHHVHYPFDDILVGNWIADWAKEGTEVVDDREGFHDALGHSWSRDMQKGVGWESVVVHKVGVREMRGLRFREEFNKEWEGI